MKKCTECDVETEKLTSIESGDYCENCSDELVTCERCEIVEHEDNMMSTDMGYLCENCEGDLC